MTDREIILHGLRDRDTESRAALARIVEERDAYRASLEAATKRVEELEAELARNILEATAIALDRAACAEARVKELIKLANAVTVSEFCGIICNDLWIDGKRVNWFEARAALAGKGE